MSAENNKNISNAINTLASTEQGSLRKLLGFLKQNQVSPAQRVEPTLDPFQMTFNFDEVERIAISEKVSSMQYVEQPDLFGAQAQRISLTHEEIAAISEYQGLDTPVVSISFKKKATDKFIKFKNMVANGLISHTPNYVLSDIATNTNKEAIDKQEDLWYRVGFQAALMVKNIKVTSKPLFDASVKAMAQAAQKAGIHMAIQSENLKANLSDSKDKLAQKSTVLKNGATGFVQSLQDLKSKITFNGEARKVKKFQKSFSYILNAMGFEANELAGDKKKDNYISPEQVAQNVISELEEYKFFVKDGKLLNTFLENAPDETVASTVYRVLWPALAKKINETMNFYQEVSAIAKNNKYLQILETFADKNNLKVEDVSHILEVDKAGFVKLFGDKKGVDKIIKNYDHISEAIIKYNELAKNNNIRMNHLLKATEDLKGEIAGLSLDEAKKSQLIKAIDDTQIFRLSGNKIITYDMVKKNVVETNKVMGQKIKI